MVDSLVLAKALLPHKIMMAPGSVQRGLLGLFLLRRVNVAGGGRSNVLESTAKLSTATGRIEHRPFGNAHLALRSGSSSGEVGGLFRAPICDFQQSQSSG